MHLIPSVLLSLLVCGSLSVAGSTELTVLDLPVKRFASHGKDAAAVFKDLARQVHVPVGISGFIVERRAKNDRTISIDVDGKSLRKVLDEICSKDPDYRWQRFDRDTIDVRIGLRPLSLINVPVKNVTLKDAYPTDVLLLPSVKAWEQATGCGAVHPMILNGNPSAQNTTRVSLAVHKAPLWKILSDASRQTGSFFWSAIGSAHNPCYVFVDLMNAK